MSGPYQDVKREVELVIGNILTEHLAIAFFPYKGDVEQEFPFGVIKCGSAKPLLGGSEPRGYMCNVRVVYVSNIDDAVSDAHSQVIAKIEDVLNMIPQMAVEAYKLKENHIQVAGMFIEDLTDESEDQSHGDMFHLKVGVTGVCKS